MSDGEDVPKDVHERINACLKSGGTSINLSYVPLDDATAPLAFREIGERCPRLTAVDLRFCGKFSDVGVTALALHCPGLTHVRLDLCPYLSDASIMSLASHCAELTHVSLGTCVKLTEASLVALASHCERLTAVSFMGCVQLTDVGVASLLRYDLPRLLHLNLQHTQVTAPEWLIESCDAQYILRYYRELNAAERAGTTRQIAEVKVLLLGQGESGKTTLRRRALSGAENDPNYREDPANRTHNVALSQFEAEGITYRVWDFGGQDHLHGTHRFFLGTDHALYVLVLDATKSPFENRLSYWLRFLAHHGTKSETQKAPVLIVLNKCEEVALAADDSEIARRHADLRHELELAAQHGWFGANVVAAPICGQGRPASDASIDPELSAEIQKGHLTALETFHAEFARATEQVVNLRQDYTPGHAALKEFVAERFHDADADGEDHFSGERWLDRHCEDVQAVFREWGVTDEALQTIYLRLVCDLGLAHFVGDLPEVRQEDNTDMQVKLFNPGWVKRPVYSLIRYAEDQHGWVSHQQFGRALEDPMAGRLHEPLERNVIRRLMLVCRLAFEMEIDGRTDGLLIPDRLPPRTPELMAAWTGEGLTRETLAAPFIPERVFLRFVAAHYEQVRDRQTECFRNEIVIPQRDGVTVLVQSYLSPVGMELPRIEITARGGKDEVRRWVIDAILEEFDKIMRREGIDRDRNAYRSSSAQAEIPTGDDDVAKSAVPVNHELVLDNFELRYGDRVCSFRTQRKNEVAKCWYTLEAVHAEWLKNPNTPVVISELHPGKEIENEALRKQFDQINSRLKQTFGEQIRIERDGMKTARLVVEPLS